MSPQRKRQLSKVALALAPVTLGALIWAAKAFAWQQVEPVESRVTVLETQRAEDVKRLDEIRQDVKDIKNHLLNQADRERR